MDLVRFYACAGDTLSVAAKLLSKAQDRGEVVRVYGNGDSLQRLSDRLWLVPGFIAHATPSSSEAVLRRSRVQLGEEPQTSFPVDLVLNLGTDLKLEGLQAKRVFDVFGTEFEERQAARARYRRCQAAGWLTEAVQVGGA